MPDPSSSQDPQPSKSTVKTKSDKRSDTTSLTSLQKRVDESNMFTDKIEMMMEEVDESHSAQSQCGVWLACLIPQIDGTLIQEYYKCSFALMMQFVEDSIAL